MHTPATAAGTANPTPQESALPNPTPQEINRYLIPLSFFERISVVVKGIFSKESFSSLCAKEYKGIFSKDFKSLCGIKYKIKKDFLQNSGIRKNKEAYKTILENIFYIRGTDIQNYLQKFTKSEIDCLVKNSIALV